MKRSIILFFLILILVGCNNKEIISEVEYNYNRSFYKIYEPHKSYAVNNYSVNRTFNRYDLREVEMGLMRISTKYFSNNKYYYQMGNYISEEEQIELLSYEKLNSNSDSNLEYKPKYISYIHEQNYLNKKGEIKGISLAVVLNPYQSYTVNGKTKRDVVNIDKLIEFGQGKVDELVNYIRSKKELKDIEIVIGLFVQQSTSSLVPGAYVYETFIREGNIKKFTKLNEKYYLLTDNKLKDIDINSYEAFVKLKDKIQLLTSNIFIMGRGLYINNQLQKLTIDVNMNYVTIGEVNSLSQLIASEIVSLFNEKTIIEVIIKSENKVEAIVSKDNNQNKSKIFFIN